MKPRVDWDEGDMVVIDLTGKGGWEAGDDYDRATTWFVTPEQAEALLVALVEFLMPEPPTEEDLEF